MKEKDDHKIILFQSDSKIERIDEKELTVSNTVFTEYILIPDYDTNGYLLITPSEYLQLTHAKISYRLMSEIGDPTKDYYTYENNLSDERTIEVDNSVDFYQAIWSILKIRMAGELIAGDYDSSYMFGMLTSPLCIDIKLSNGKDIHYEDELMIDKEVSFASQMIKIAKNISKAFYIPHHEFRYTDKFFKIEKNKWSTVNLDEINSEDLVGFISDTSMQVYFDNYYNLEPYIKNPISVTINVLTRKHFEMVINKSMTECTEEDINRVNIDDICSVSLFDQYDIIHLHNDRITFLINIDYILRYLEGMIVIAYSNVMEAVAFIEVEDEDNHTNRFFKYN